MNARLLWRKSAEHDHAFAHGLCALITVSALFFILGYLVWNGGKGIFPGISSRSFPPPSAKLAEEWPMRSVGSLKLLLLGDAVRRSHWLCWAACTWRNSGGGRSRLWCGIQRICLNGVPSIVIGIFAYALSGNAYASLFDAGRGIRAWNHGDSNCDSKHGEFFARRSALPARGLFSPWALNRSGR